MTVSSSSSRGSGIYEGPQGVAPLPTPRELETADTAPTPTPAPALGAKVGGGMSWMLLATGVTKLSTFFAQAVLGWILIQKDFGLFAIATTVAGFVMVCRDAGMRELLTQRAHESYDDLAGPAHWFALSYNLLAAAVLVGISYPLSVHVYEDPRLVQMLWIMALAIPLSTPAGILMAKLRADLRFGTVSWIAGSSALFRQIATVALALWGFGELSLAIPVALAALYDTVVCWIVTRDRFYARPAQPRRWPALFKEAKWLMFGSLGNFALDFGPYLLMGVFISSAVVGSYFFAYQITAQIGVLLSYNLQLVLFPALTRLNKEPERQRAAMLRALRALMLVGSISSLGLAAVIIPMEDLIWRGRWAPESLVVIVFGVFFPWRITYGLCAAMLMARGRFQAYAWMTAIEGVGLIVFSTVASAITPDPVLIALATGIWLLIARLGSTLWLVRQVGATASESLRSLMPAWLFAILAGLLGLAADRFILAPYMEPLPPEPTRTMLNVARILLAGSVCALTFLALTRFRLKDQLRETVAAFPGPIRTLGFRILRLPAN